MLNSYTYGDGQLMTEELARYYKKKLKHKMQYLEDTIDIHLNAIGGLQFYLDKSYIYKLGVLQANEAQIKESGEHMALRIVDKMQSYNLYDSEVFYREKLILNRIDRELLEMDHLEIEKPVRCWKQSK